VRSVCEDFGGKDDFQEEHLSGCTSVRDGSPCGAQTKTGPKELTVERIYSQPSLSGRLYSGLAWTPDGKTLTYLETKGRGKEATKELWSISAETVSGSNC